MNNNKIRVREAISTSISLVLILLKELFNNIDNFQKKTYKIIKIEEQVKEDPKAIDTDNISTI